MSSSGTCCDKSFVLQFFYEIEMLQSAMDRMQTELKTLDSATLSKQSSITDVAAILTALQKHEQTIQVKESQHRNQKM